MIYTILLHRTYEDYTYARNFINAVDMKYTSIEGFCHQYNMIGFLQLLVIQ